jgi:hypothetical protein
LLIGYALVWTRDRSSGVLRQVNTPPPGFHGTGLPYYYSPIDEQPPAVLRIPGNSTHYLIEHDTRPDARYIALRNPADNRLYIFDRTTRRIILSVPCFYDSPDERRLLVHYGFRAVWAEDHGRFLIITNSRRTYTMLNHGAEMVFPARNDVASIYTRQGLVTRVQSNLPNEHWCTEDDGSTWLLAAHPFEYVEEASPDRLRILHWRKGPITSTTVMIPFLGNTSRRDIEMREDGRLLAYSVRLENALFSNLKQVNIDVPGQARRLTLLRDGKRIGTATIGRAWSLAKLHHRDLARGCGIGWYSERITFSQNGSSLVWEMDSCCTDDFDGTHFYQIR